jgi:hypothetical protein
VFIVFNRPDLTARVFAAIARARPRQLLVIADGPRPGQSDDVPKCKATRQIAENVTWPCELLTNYAADNLGCRKRIATGLTWAFERVPEAIILEDDCLPAVSFFEFCQALLDRYRHNDTIMHIGGTNLVLANQGGQHSYYFSRYAHVWGWASWQRAWRKYQSDMADWPEWKQTLRGLLSDRREVDYWTRKFDATWSGRIDTWDFPWLYSCWRAGGLAITPTRNLVSNLGFRSDGTHTVAFDARTAELTVTEIERLVHPPVIAADEEADRRSFQHLFHEGGMPARIARRLARSLLGRWRQVHRSVNGLRKGRASKGL